MSYSLAVWVGPAPTSDAEAQRDFEQLSTTYFGDHPEPPAPQILAYLAKATARFPDLTDLTDDQVDDGVWSDGPLLGNVSGPIFHFGLCRHGVDQALAFLTELALEHGLAGYDPQTGKRLHA